MARQKRKLSNTGIFHVILRGNNKNVIFYNDSDKSFFLRRLKSYSEMMKISVFAYCLMDNHVHLLIGNANDCISSFMQRLATSYAMFLNRKYEMCGHVFQDRFKSEPVEDEIYFKSALRYILMNPQKAGICDFRSYKWSSLQDTMAPVQVIVDNGYIQGFFQNKENLSHFLCLENNDICMEYENKFFVNDCRAVKIIKKICGIESPEKFIYLNLNAEIKKAKIKKLLAAGLSVNQISKLTRIPRYFIKDSY